MINAIRIMPRRGKLIIQKKLADYSVPGIVTFKWENARPEDMEEIVRFIDHQKTGPPYD